MNHQVNLLEETDYRVVMKTAIENHLSNKGHARKSARWFAKQVSISASHLSEVLSGKANLSVKQSEKIAGRLFSSQPEQSYFCTLVSLASEKNSDHQKLLLKSLHSIRESSKTKQLDDDVSKRISDWRYYAILTAITLVKQVDDLNDVAKKIGWTQSQLANAIERLVRLGLVEWQGAKLFVCAKKTNATPVVPSAAIRDFHRGVLQHAAIQMETQDRSKRDFSVRILSIDENDIPAVKERLQKFRDELAAEFASKPSANKVYNLSMQFFDLIGE